MDSLTGKTIAHYRITGTLGEGGMGAVYRARDTKLDRDVAIKVLPPAFAHDPERRARFEREAKALAALNHPNIAAIHGLEDNAIIMELVEGPTLADRLRAGARPLSETLAIARQIADAVEAAHDKGIVHRDLKPANIKVREDGTVKVLDFGLATAVQAVREPGTDPANSPTLTMGATEAGVILGTAQYMSPEQASGKPVDRRADIWSFGVVLWEMFTGQRLFGGGETISHTLADVLRKELDWSALTAPAQIVELMKRCLDRNLKTRLRDIGEARIALERFIADPKSGTEVPLQTKARATWAWAIAGACALAAVGVAFVHFREIPTKAEVLQYTIAPPENRVGSMALSPDGRMLAISTGLASSLLTVRNLGEIEGRALTGTEGARFPFWSPDGRDIGFFANGKLKRVPSSGGPVQVVCDATEAPRGSWNQDGLIVLTDMVGRGQFTVPASGGTPKGLPNPEKDAFVPYFLPDGQTYLEGSRSGIYVTKLQGGERKRILLDRSNAAYAPPLGAGATGYVLFVRNGALMAQPVDPGTFDVRGEAFPVADQITSRENIGYFPFHVSETGVLAYRFGAEGDKRQLTWLDRTGKVLSTVGPTVASTGRLALSPDGTKAITEHGDQVSNEKWLVELDRSTESRLTFGTSTGSTVVWSPDAKSVGMFSGGGTEHGLFRLPSDGSGKGEMLSKGAGQPTDWTRDGAYILYRSQEGSSAKYDIMALPAAGGKPVPLLASEANEVMATVSPDGKWVAYASDESGKYEVYVRPFAPGKPEGGKWLVSSGDGRDPHWRGDGKELFYVTSNSKMMAVDVGASGNTFTRGVPRELFTVPYNTSGNTISRYAVAADGKRFLVGAESEHAGDVIRVIVNWQASVGK